MIVAVGADGEEMTWTVTCPHCHHRSPWEPVAERIVVRCALCWQDFLVKAIKP